MEDVKVSFDSLGEMLEFLESTNPIRDPLSCMSGGDWSGTSSMKEARKFAIEGWEEGTKDIERFSSMFMEKLTNRLKIDDYYYDVTGQDFDLDRVLIGEPECWMQSEQIEVIAPAQHNVQILVNVGALSSVKASTVRRKGSAICALVMLLERARRGVEVIAVSKAKGYESFHGTCEVRLLVKKAGEQLDLAKLAFIFANVAFLRRFVFGVRERKWDALRAKINHGHYGFSMEVVKGGADIYCSINDGAMYFDSDQATEKWILEVLKGQGVELKGEGEC